MRYSDRTCYGLCVLINDIGRRLPLPNFSEAIEVNGVMLVSLCAETIKPVLGGYKILQLWKERHQFRVGCWVLACTNRLDDKQPPLTDSYSTAGSAHNTTFRTEFG